METEFTYRTIQPFKLYSSGNSLAVQWLELRVLILPKPQVQSLVGKVRSHKSCSVAKNFLN